MQLRNRLFYLRSWWIIVSIVQSYHIFQRFRQCTVNKYAFLSSADTVNWEAVSSTCILDILLPMDISLYLLPFHLFLEIIPIILGLFALYTNGQCSTKDFQSHMLSEQSSWIYHPSQTGELPTQRYPHRILSPKTIASVLNNNNNNYSKNFNPIRYTVSNNTYTNKKSALRIDLQAATFESKVMMYDNNKSNLSLSDVSMVSPVSSSVPIDNDLWTSILANPSTVPKSFFRPLRIVILTVGTRGDVQPFIVLAQHIREAGHSVAIVSSTNFQKLIEDSGLEFISSGIEKIYQPKEWAEVTSTADFIRVTGPMLISDFIRVGNLFRSSILEPRADVIVGTAMTVSFALDLSEATGIPCWVAKLAPDLPTSGFITPGSHESSIGWYNLVRCYAYWLKVAMAANGVGLSNQENRWRTQYLGISKMVDEERVNDMSYTPQLLGVSRHLMPKPVDYPLWSFQCGFWTTADISSRRIAPPNVAPLLRKWIENSITGRPIAVVTFGSMTNVPGRPTILADITEAFVIRGHRVIVLTGWSGGVPPGLEKYAAQQEQQIQEYVELRKRMSGNTDLENNKVSKANLCGLEKSNVFIWDEAPHEWLFCKIAMVAHHGGAGTTARALACGIPSLIIPVLRWADQMQYGQLVTDARVGYLVREKNPSKEKIGQAIDIILKDHRNDPSNTTTIPNVANKTGAFVRAETSSDTALALFESCLCNLLLSPTEADIIHPRRSSSVLPLWKNLTKVQRMCVRHCIPCSRLRSEGNVVLPTGEQLALMAQQAILPPPPPAPSMMKEELLSTTDISTPTNSFTTVRMNTNEVSATAHTKPNKTEEDINNVETEEDPSEIEDNFEKRISTRLRKSSTEIKSPRPTKKSSKKKR